MKMNVEIDINDLVYLLLKKKQWDELKKVFDNCSVAQLDSLQKFYWKSYFPNNYYCEYDIDQEKMKMTLLQVLITENCYTLVDLVLSKGVQEDNCIKFAHTAKMIKLLLRYRRGEEKEKLCFHHFLINESKAGKDGKIFCSLRIIQLLLKSCFDGKEEDKFGHTAHRHLLYITYGTYHDADEMDAIDYNRNQCLITMINAGVDITWDVIHLWDNCDTNELNDYDKWGNVEPDEFDEGYYRLRTRKLLVTLLQYGAIDYCPISDDNQTTYRELISGYYPNIYVEVNMKRKIAKLREVEHVLSCATLLDGTTSCFFNSCSNEVLDFHKMFGETVLPMIFESRVSFQNFIEDEEDEDDEDDEDEEMWMKIV